MNRQMLDGWNNRIADAFAVPFAEDGESIGFDGSQLVGRTKIISTLRQIFADHPSIWSGSALHEVSLLALTQPALTCEPVSRLPQRSRVPPQQVALSSV